MTGDSDPASTRVVGVLGPAAMLLQALAMRDWRPLSVGIIASGIAATVATFQFAVFTSFLQAGAAAPRYLAADAWISAAGIACFDFPTLIDEDYAGAIRAEFPDASIRRVAFGFAGWISPTGQRGNVALIGVDRSNADPRSFEVDPSDTRRLDVAYVGAEASIGGRTMTYAGPTHGLATFLGAPYAVSGFEEARAVLGMAPGAAAFLAVDFPHGAPTDLVARLAHIEQRFPELSARSSEQFLSDSSTYWQAKTGAGAAILLAAMLASVLMVILLLNGVGRFMQRRNADFISMIGHGASDAQMAAVLIGVAGMLIAGALAMAAFLVPAMNLIVRPFLPWVTLKLVDAAFALAVAGLCLVLAILSARRELKRFPPDAIFRS